MKIKFLQIKKYLCLIFLLVLTMSCNGQNKELQEAKLALEEKIDLQVMRARLDSIREPIYSSLITINPIAEENSKRYSDSFLVKKKLMRYLNTMYFEQYIEYPENYINVSYRSRSFGGVTGDRDYLENNSMETPIFLLDKIIFRDNTSQIIADTLTFGKTLRQKHKQIDLAVNSTKPVKQLEVNVMYKYPKVEKVSLRKDQLKVNLPEGPVNLRSIAYNHVSFTIPKALKDKFVAVIAYDSIGEPVEIDKFNKNQSHLDDLATAKKIINARKNAVEKLNNNEFKNKEELDQYLIKELLSKDQDANEILLIFQFKKVIAFVDLFFQTGEKIDVNQNIVIENVQDRITSLNFFVANDTLTKKKGFVGLDGNYIKPPVFKHLYYVNDYYYHGIKEVDTVKDEHSYGLREDAYYLLNNKKGTFTEVDYLLFNNEIHHNNLAIINNNKKEVGIVNAETNQIRLPLKYEHVRYENGLFIVRNKEGKKGVYNVEMKQILSVIYNSIEIEKDKIVTKIRVSGQLDIKENFTKKGVKLKD